MEDYLRQYGLIAIFVGVAVFAPASMLVISFLLGRLGVRPEKPNDVKGEIYECGMETIGGRWGQFNFRYYMYALLFVILDVSVIFVYPWATQLGKLGLFALIEMLAFMTILGFGWVYAWKKQDLEWR